MGFLSQTQWWWFPDSGQRDQTDHPKNMRWYTWVSAMKIFADCGDYLCITIPVWNPQNHNTWTSHPCLTLAHTSALDALTMTNLCISFPSRLSEISDFKDYFFFMSTFLQRGYGHVRARYIGEVLQELWGGGTWYVTIGSVLNHKGPWSVWQVCG